MHGTAIASRSVYAYSLYYIVFLYDNVYVHPCMQVPALKEISD